MRQLPKMSEQEIDEAARVLREELDHYMASAEFEVLAIAAAAEIQRGGLRTACKLAAALGLPEQFLDFAIEKHNKRFLADRGGLQ